MPQMAPMLWLILMASFICMFLLFIIMNYYSFSMIMNKNNIKYDMKLKNFSWKW
uniref:ATP synthase complex subunit 8 n=1 Tax=Stenischia montanis TaxID=3104522 RepID=A0AAU8L436_9NEOP|nr:ATP synthase F0 subunit 8 [Stenischia montanis yunlongensis]